MREFYDYQRESQPLGRYGYCTALVCGGVTLLKIYRVWALRMLLRKMLRGGQPGAPQRPKVSSVYIRQRPRVN